MKVNRIGIIMALVAMSFIFTSFTGLLAGATITGGGFTIYSPSQNNQVYQYGQTVNLIFTSPYKSSEFTITIDHYENGVPKLYNSIGEITNSTGGFSGAILSGDNPIGTYLIIVNDAQYSASVAFNVTIVPPHYEQATLLVTVENEANEPISGAAVEVLNSTTNALVTSGTTTSSGTVSLTVPYFGVPVTYIVKASASGYVTENTTVDVTSNGTFPVTLILPTIGFSLSEEGVFQNGQSIAPPTDNFVNVYQGIPLTIEYKAVNNGMPASGAEITEMVTFPNGSTVDYTGTVGSTGLVNITFTPTISPNTTLNMIIKASATYNSMNTSLPYSIYVTATFNYYKTISEIESEIASLESTTSYLNKSIMSLNSTVSSLESKITSLSNELSSLNKTLISLNNTVTNINSTTVPNLEAKISSLSSQISSLKSELSSVNSTVSSLKSSVSSATTLIYAALIAGIIGLIIAIVAIVLVLRKIK